MGPCLDIIDRKVIFVTGKGGIGKTFYAVNLALAASRAGKKVCLVQNRIDDQISSLFNIKAARHQTCSLAPRLDMINLDNDLNFRDFVVKHLGFESLFDKVFNTKIIQSLTKTLPGIAEMTYLGRIYHLATISDENYDLIVCDTFASGHFLNLMTSPAAILNASLGGPISEETRKVATFLSDPQLSGISLVTGASPLVMSEAIDFIPLIGQANSCKLAEIVVNRFINDEALSAESTTAPAQLRHYLMNRYAGNAEQCRLLISFLQSQGYALTLKIIPDFGVFAEPLSEEDHLRFIQQMEQIQWAN